MEQVINERKLSLIKRYPTEVLVVLLLFAVCYLGVGLGRTDSKVDKLQMEMKTYLHDDRAKLIETLQENTEVNNRVLEYIKK